MSSRAGPSTKRITRSAAKQEIGDVPADSTARIPLPSKSGLVEAESGEHDQPPRKRVKTTAPEPEPKPAAAPLRRTRGKQGKLQGLMNMPVDIFTEIAIYLHPIDLVYLARANKFFRKLLMNRSFIHIWRCAERSVEGLPPCPEGLCEPQYASLVFAKCCSTCGGQALRPMDPILQVRLCVKCRGEQAVNVRELPVDASLVFRSRDFIPGKYLEVWCLINDARAVKDKLDALVCASNQQEKKDWIQTRKAVVVERIKNAQPLAQFLKSIESDHGAELSSVRDQREAEVKSRLLKLGYEKQDILIYERHWQKLWKSAACIAKPLTERAWEAILPSLITGVERNRDCRLEREKAQRKGERERRIHDWVKPICSSLSPFARALSTTAPGASNIGEVSIPGSSNTDADSLLMPVMESNNIMKLMAAIPCSQQMIYSPIFATMLEQEMSLEELDEALKQSRPAVDKLVSEWTQDLERTLVGLLPEEAVPGESKNILGSDDNTTTQVTSLIPAYTYVLGDGPPMRSLSELSLDVQRLLRADCVFREGSTLVFYPDDFDGGFYKDKIHVTYHPLAVKVARALLASLGLPDAIYLRLKAAGPTFVCGRCDIGKCMTWKQAVRHYANDEAAYVAFQQSAKAQEASFTYVFTHDVNVAMPDKPLLRVTRTEAPPTSSGSHQHTRRCLVCKTANVDYQRGEDLLLRHIREIHLIETPRLKKHYR